MRRSRVFCTLCMLCLLLTMLAVPAMAAGHSHCVCAESTSCGSSHTASKQWTATSTLPTKAGYYYLTKDITISATWVPVNGTYLCLNGHDITMTGSGSVISVGQSVNLSISDCSRTVTAGYIDETTGLWKPGTGTGTAYSLTGGIISGGTGSVSGNWCCGGGVYQTTP